VVGKRSFAVRAFQPQNPGSIDANTVLHENTKGSSPALMDAEIPLGGATMGAGLAIARVLSGFEFFRVVLDF
jgi:hypothetical protein